MNRQVTVDEALERLEDLLESDYCNQIQASIFRSIWDGQSYIEIANSTEYDYGHSKDINAQLWRCLLETLGKKVTKSYVRNTLCKISRNNLQVGEPPVANLNTLKVKQSWEGRIDVERLYGRCEERRILIDWIIQDCCRLVSILGIGGIGKTALIFKLAANIQAHFDYVIWRSLQRDFPIEELLSDIIRFLSDQQDTSVPNLDDRTISYLLIHLRQNRCLLVLDNAESVLRKDTGADCYQEAYQAYGSLFRRIADASYQSCLLITNRENPLGISRRDRTHSLVNSLRINGLDPTTNNKIFQTRLSIVENEYEQLYNHYRGNLLTLKIVAATVKSVFDGRVAEFSNCDTLLFRKLWDVLERQFARLTELKKRVMYWLAVNRDWVKLPDLREELLSTVSYRALLEATKLLKVRFLIETGIEGITQQPIVMKYTYARAIDYSVLWRSKSM